MKFWLIIFMFLNIYNSVYCSIIFEENEKTEEYTVKSGDNLTKIAKKFNTTIDDICQLNNIDNPDLIKPGQKLQIKTSAPSDSQPEKEKEEPKKEENKNQASDGEYKQYVIQSGDALSKIAKKVGVPVKEIMTLNNITDANKIKVGQKLKLSPTAINAEPYVDMSKFVVADPNAVPRDYKSPIDLKKPDTTRDETIENAIKFIKHYEGDIPYQKAKGSYKNGKFQVYKCQAGKETVGYGTTDKEKIEYAKKHNGIDEKTAIQWLAEGVAKRYDNLAKTYGPYFTSLKMLQKMVYVSLAYNTNNGNFVKYKNLHAAIKKHDFYNMWWEMHNIVKAGDEESEGLKIRRKKEMEIFLQAEKDGKNDK